MYRVSSFGLNKHQKLYWRYVEMSGIGATDAVVAVALRSGSPGPTAVRCVFSSKVGSPRPFRLTVTMSGKTERTLALLVWAVVDVFSGVYL